MPKRTVQLIANHFYHIYNRGHNYAKIFFEQENYVFFLKRLRQYITAQHADILAYALMPNHYHLLVKLHNDDFSHAMQNFAISYTKAMNERYHRTGSMFQGAFQARLVDKDEYLLQLSRYIHLNPVQVGLVKRPQDWVYSSYQEYIGLRHGTLPKSETVLAQFRSLPQPSQASLQTSEVLETSEVLAAFARYRDFVESGAHSDAISHLVID